MPILATFAVASSLGALFADFPPVYRELYLERLNRVRSGAQCRYGDGEKGVVLKLSAPHKLVMILVDSKGPGALADIRVRRNGSLDVEANGGITSYLAYARSTRYLMRKPQTPLTPRDLPAFFAKKDVPACPYKTWADHAYEDGLREHGRPGQEH